MNRSKNNLGFNFLDKHSEVSQTERNLPHWLQESTATFVTFRTADSLPRQVILGWRRELEHWLEGQDLPLDWARSVTELNWIGQITTDRTISPDLRRKLRLFSDRLYQNTLDECHGECLLKNQEVAEQVANAMLFHNQSNYDLDRFVVMPNHVHAIVQFQAGSNLEIVSQSWMRYSAREINKITGRSGSFWQAEPFDHIIRSPEQFEYLQNYIADNPSKAKLRPGEYLYWQRPE